MPKFTISRHSNGPEGDHFDLFLEEGESLRTWRIQSTDFLKMQSAQRMEDHRKKYLDYEGDVSGDRGQVEIWDKGEYILDRQSSIHMRLALSGEKIKTRLCFDRRGDQAEASTEGSQWLVYDGAEKLRRLVTQHFRRTGLPDPESAELQKMMEELTRRERTLAGVADKFIRGREVDWSKLESDSQLTKRIRELRARWVHPWLVQAYRFAMRLDRWARHIRAYHAVQT